MKGPNPSAATVESDLPPAVPSPCLKGGMLNETAGCPEAAEFVSIVGVSRSGTTLMQHILNKSKQLAIADENNFLGHIVKSEGVRYKLHQFGDLSMEHNASRLVDYIYSHELRAHLRYNNYEYWRWLIDHVDREVLTSKISASVRSDKDLFVELIKPFADWNGKTIIGEKSPNHFHYVSTILEWFPNGRIVHLIRDPRGNYVSELKRRQIRASHTLPIPFRQIQKFNGLLKIFILVVLMYSWYKSAGNAVSYSMKYPDRYYVIRFEDLVSSPDVHVPELCDFLGIDYDPAMLDQWSRRGYFNRGKKGFDQDAVTRWRDNIDRWVDISLRVVLSTYMKRFNYV